MAPEVREIANLQPADYTQRGDRPTRSERREALAQRLALPVWLLALEAAICDGLPARMAAAWSQAFLDAIEPGAELESIATRLGATRLAETVLPLARCWPAEIRAHVRLAVGLTIRGCRAPQTVPARAARTIGHAKTLTLRHAARPGRTPGAQAAVWAMDCAEHAGGQHQARAAIAAVCSVEHADNLRPVPGEMGWRVGQEAWCAEARRALAALHAARALDGSAAA